MLGPMKLLKARYAALALAALGGWEVYSFFVPPEPELEPEKMRAADRAAEIVASAMPEDWRRRKMLVTPFGSDASGYVRQSVTRAVRRLDRAKPISPPVTEKAVAALARMVGTRDDAASAEARGSALELADETGAELLMLGQVRELSLTEGVPRIEFTVQVLDVRARSQLWEKAVSWTPPFLERTVGLISPMKRAIGWILFVLLLPWAALPLVKAVVKKESNAANAALLVALVGLSVVLAYVALAGDLSGWAGAFFLLAVAFGFFYHAGVLNHIAGLGS